MLIRTNTVYNGHSERSEMLEKTTLKQKNIIVYITDINEKQALILTHITHTLHFSLILIKHYSKRFLMLDLIKQSKQMLIYSC